MNALYIPLSTQQSIINQNTVNIQLIVSWSMRPWCNFMLWCQLHNIY